MSLVAIFLAAFSSALPALSNCSISETVPSINGPYFDRNTFFEGYEDILVDCKTDNCTSVLYDVASIYTATSGPVPGYDLLSLSYQFFGNHSSLGPAISELSMYSYLDERLVSRKNKNLASFYKSVSISCSDGSALQVNGTSQFLPLFGRRD